MSGRAILGHLRISVMVAYVIAWNALILGGMWLGGRGLTYESQIARLMGVVALAGTAVFAALISYSSKVQALTLRSREDMAQLRKELLFIVALTTLLSIAIVGGLIAE